jgi:hypothetical protein
VLQLYSRASVSGAEDYAPSPWEHHPDPASEPRMLDSLYENGLCPFCRESVVKRLIDLDSLTDSLRAECACDASDEIRELVGASS